MLWAFNNGSRSGGKWNDWFNDPAAQDSNVKLSGIVEIKGVNSISTSASLTVNAVNDAPELTGEQYNFADSLQGESIFISQEQLLQGYTDVDGDRLQIQYLSATNGALTCLFNYYEATNEENSVEL